MNTSYGAPPQGGVNNQPPKNVPVPTTTPAVASRSRTFFGERGTPAGFTACAFTKAMGFSQEDLARPIIGIAQTWSEFNNCNNHFRQLAEAVKRGVWQEGGLPLEFPTISLGEVRTQPTTMRQPPRCCFQVRRRICCRYLKQ